METFSVIVKYFKLSRDLNFKINSYKWRVFFNHGIRGICFYLHILVFIFKEKIYLGPTFFKQKWVFWGFPGGAAVESLPANAGDAGSSPGLGRSHMPQSDWAREPQLLSLRVWSLCSATGEAAVVGGPRTAMKRGLRLPQLERALAQKRRPNTEIGRASCRERV